MVKPGHTLTIGPLTFRADYEPADSFMSVGRPRPSTQRRGDRHRQAAGSATTAMELWREKNLPGILEVPEEGTTGDDYANYKAFGHSRRLEFEEFSVDDLAELDMPAEVGSADGGSDIGIESEGDAENAIAAETSAPTAKPLRPRQAPPPRKRSRSTTTWRWNSISMTWGAMI